MPFHLKDQPIPDGYQIYEERFEVAGLWYNRVAFRGFAWGSGRRVELVQEPVERWDMNAVAIYGSYTGMRDQQHRVRLGFLPRDIAGAMARSPIRGEILPRVVMTYAGDCGRVQMLMQLIGPKKHFRDYRPDGLRGERA